MRSSVLRSRIKTLIRASSLGAAGVLVAGCSSGFERFDHYYRSATPQQQAAGQAAAMGQAGMPNMAAFGGGFMNMFRGQGGMMPGAMMGAAILVGTCTHSLLWEPRHWWA